ncbi:MAG: hypothetical protein Q9162_003878 [Coniocarpon cinnabarinum]
MSAASSQRPVSVLFVCLGNICRSPMAEGVFRNLTNTLPSSSQNPNASNRFVIDSAGTGAYHALSPPDPRTMETLEKHGVTTYDHAARKLRPQDFLDFDYIFAMDSENLEDIEEAKTRFVRNRKRSSAAEEKPLAKTLMYGSFGGKSADEEVDDPYYGGQNGFDVAYEQVTRFAKGFLTSLEEN